MLQIDPRFVRLLGAHTLTGLDAEQGSVIGLWPDGRIALLNSGWQRFAEENGGAEVMQRWTLGSDLLLGISGLLRDYYAYAFAGVREHRKPWTQSYECNTPTLRRQFHLRVLPLRDRGLLLIHSLAVGHSSRMDESASTFDEPGRLPPPARRATPSLTDYVGPNGLVRQCSNCRRTQRIGANAWDWVSRYVERPPANVTHALCAVCMRQDYPDFVSPDSR